MPAYLSRCSSGHSDPLHLSRRYFLGVFHSRRNSNNRAGYQPDANLWELFYISIVINVKKCDLKGAAGTKSEGKFLKVSTAH